MDKSRNNMKPEDIDQLIQDFYREKDRNVRIPKGLESRLETLIDDLDAAEQDRKVRRLPLWKWATGIAASLAILASLGIYFNRPADTPYYISEEVQSTITDPDEAYEITAQALTLVSMNLNKGLSQLQQVEANLERTNKIINKSLKR